MTDIVRKEESQAWGEDPHRSLSVARHTGSSSLIQKAEGDVLRQYRLRLRDEFERNEAVAEVLKRSFPARSAAREVSQLLSEMVREESSDLFAQALDELLDELEGMRKKPGSIYLVEQETGKASIAISERSVYQPPDFVGDDGKLRKAQPVVHPGIVAPLAMERHEKGRMEELAAKAGPHAAMALEHLRGEDVVRARAVEALAELGVQQEFEGPFRTAEIEFGEEHSSGAFQSLNPRFHRAHSFGRALARRIKAEARACRIVKVERKATSRKTWYVATIELSLTR